MISGGLLEKFQIGLEKYLHGLNEFRSTPIITTKQSDIDAILRTSTGGGIGVVILVLPPTPVDVMPNTPGPVFRKIMCKIQVIENLATNRTGRSAIFIAEKIMQYLHLWRPQVADWNDELALSDDSPWKASQEGNTSVITMQFETHCSLKST
jgi:hypothetical protein